MKKTILMISMTGMLFLSGLNLVVAQTQPSAKKDSVNADKAAKPVFYDAAAEEQTPKSGSGSNYALIGGVIVVVGAASYFLMRKKKN
jgi:LPXTG-motif cell wall-anchored protein